MEEQIKRMAGISGEATSKPVKYNVPLIKFNGTKGDFTKVIFNKDGTKTEISVSKPVKIVILKQRRTLSSFSPTASYFTNEHNTKNDKISLFKRVDSTVTFEMDGFADEIRNKYQALRTHVIDYVLFDSEICKLEIKGGSLSGYWDLLKELADKSMHTFQVQIELNSEKTKNEAGFGFFKMIYSIKELDTDMNIVEEKMTEVVTNLHKVDEYFIQKSKPNTPEIIKDTITFDDDTSEDIKPEDIPF